MNERDYEILSQYLDGELSAPATQELRHRLMADPQLRATLERLQAVDERMKDAFNTPGVDTVPPGVVKLLQQAGTDTGRGSRQRRAGWGFAVAASLVAATALLLIPDETPRSGADDLLAGVLERSASRAEGWDSLSDGRKVRPLLSFRSVEGTWCREYFVSDQGNSSRGVACRSEGQWLTAVLGAEELAGSAEGYRPAGVTQSGRITSYVDTHASGIPLSLQQEADLIGRNWQ